jgi:ribosomal protein S18 acetylase RimI-like enzyme
LASPSRSPVRLTVRDARADELQAVYDLTRRAYAEYATAMDPNSWEALSGAIDAGLSSDQEMQRIVAVEGDTIVGSALLLPPSEDAYKGFGVRVTAPEVRLVAVDPAARGRGVAHALMNECLRRARESGATEIGLHTSGSMKAAMQMYERMGFQRAPESDFQPPGTERVVGYRLVLK